MDRNKAQEKPAFPHYGGNKANLPRKICAACGREVVWRKRWAKQWAEVKYCSDRCRVKKG